MNINAGSVGVAGFYTFLLNGVPVFESECKNLITNFGWDKLFTAAGGALATNGTVLQVGTGNTAPAVTDVALAAFLAQVAGPNTGTLTSGTDTNGAYAGTRLSYAFSIGAVVGNVAEVGLKLETADGSISSRSLVKDAGGNPATIVVTSMDQLTVIYELRYYRQPIDSSGSVTVAGVPTTYLFRTALPQAGTVGNTGYIGTFRPFSISVDHFGTGSTFGAVGADVSGTVTSALIQSGVTVTANSSTGIITVTTGNIGTGSGNSSGGVINMRFSLFANVGNTLGVYGFLKLNFTPAIPKDNTKIMSYAFSFTMYRI